MARGDLRCDVIDINSATVSLTGNSNVLVKYFSTAQVTAYATAGNPPINLDTFAIRNGNKRVLGAKAIFYNVESDTFVISSEYSDGQRVEKSVVFDMVDYIMLTCNTKVASVNASGDATLQCVGNCFNGSFGAQSNTLSVQYRYRANGGSWSSWDSMSVSKSGNTYAATASHSGLDYEAVYEFEFLAKDKLMEANPSTGNVASLPVFHWGKNDVTFEVPVKFNKGVNGFRVSGNLQFGSLANSFCYITNTNEQLHLVSNGLLYNGQSVAFAEHGTWTPQLYGIHPTTRQYKICYAAMTENSGWYSKSGNVVTVGFRIKFDLTGTSNDDDIIAIAMQGLPYTPAIPSSGGGMCSGALMKTNQNFQCFVAETDGFITTRTQACDYTAGSFLETSKDGCRYSYSSPGLTLSGTITFMTN